MDEPISKSQKKRDAQALQSLGVELVALPLEKLDTLPLSDALRAAILVAKKLKSFGAIRRQSQLIGKLMRQADYETIIVAYEQIKALESAQTASFHEVEQWRQRLMTQGKEALTEFICSYPQVDSQQLRQLIKQAIANKPVGAYKAFFRLLRTYVL